MAGFLNRLRNTLGWGRQTGSRYVVADAYQGLRQQFLTLQPGRIGLDSSAPNQVWGVLVEMGYPDAVVTLVTIADGTVSLYFSNGGGIIGAGQHQGPRRASLGLLSTAPAFLQHATRTAEYPLPERGRVRFYFMTFDGAFAADVAEDDLAQNRHPLAPLFRKADDVITELRLIDEQRSTTAPGMLHAATTGKIKTLRSMLDAGTSVDIADETGLTPLMAASYAGMQEALELLLTHGAEIDAVDASGYTALMFACNTGRTDCARLLVAKGADVNHRDNDSSTPLMFAAQHAHNEIVRVLLANGADPEIKGTHGLSAIGFAEQNGHTETETILRTGR